nr:spore germination protein [Paenibacillus turpanensis]
MQANVDSIASAFHHPLNQDFVVRNFHIPALGIQASALYLIGMADTKQLEKQVIRPLLDASTIKHHERSDSLTMLKTKLLTAASVHRITDSEQAVDQIIKGNTLLLIEGTPEALYIETTGFEHRAVEKPINENVLKGPQEGFIESGTVNRSLIRKQLRDASLVTEYVNIGDRSMTQVSVLYIKDLADDKIVEKVKGRIRQIQADSIQSLSILEQHIEDRPYSLIPTVLWTERPDRAASFLLEGHVVLIMDSSPACLVAPVTFWSFFHTAEDMYERWAFGNFIRFIRLVAFFVAMLTPSIYVAVTNYHIEMLPTDLLLAIAATREKVPFPAIIEVFFMELSFELLREAGVRVPTPIGPTIGIVGALILGQAAVDANIISPILVIVVALTGLSSFAIPNISFSFLIRITRFIFLGFAALMGFFGITLFLTAAIAYMSTIKSFGVPFLSPLAPHERSSKDLIARPQVWRHWIRSMSTHPKDPFRKKKP